MGTLFLQPNDLEDDVLGGGEVARVTEEELGDPR
jgi:hypothetical protein